MTLFFSSVGMLCEPRWIAAHLPAVLLTAIAIVIGKSAITTAVLALLRLPIRSALATGLILAQSGEFAFVLLKLGEERGLAPAVVQLLVSATVISLFLTPSLVALAGRVARARAFVEGAAGARAERATGAFRVLVIGFGPAGKVAAERLEAAAAAVEVLDLNPALLQQAAQAGFRTHLGDATHAEVLEHVDLAALAAVVISLPDAGASAAIVRLVRSMVPGVLIVTRVRYNRFRPLLESAGAHVVVDEEEQVGAGLATEVEALLGPTSPQDTDGGDTAAASADPRR
jgi:CPA2 family monovalent cation:H+ antiporter-2